MYGSDEYQIVFVKVFLGFTMPFCSQSEWGSTLIVLMFILYWSEQITRNCTYLLKNIKQTHTKNIYFTPMTISQFKVDPHWNLWRHMKPKNSSLALDVILSHWAPSWLILQITLAVYSETVGSIYYFIVNFSVLSMLILSGSVAQ